MADSGMNGQPMEQGPSSATGLAPPPAASSYVTPEHFTSLKYFQVLNENRPNLECKIP